MGNIPISAVDTIELSKKELSRIRNVAQGEFAKVYNVVPRSCTEIPQNSSLFIVTVKYCYYVLDKNINRHRAFHKAALDVLREKQEREELRAARKLKIAELSGRDTLKLYHHNFEARSIRGRNLTLFVGPTNSGKTYHALNRLTEYDSGAYLGPLRLLAMEGQAEIEKRGKLCSYKTGDDKQYKEGARFIAQTIETLSFTETYDAVLIDEAQMLYDESRGAHWTAAIIGAKAKNIILTGAPGCIPAVQKISEILNEPLEIIHLNRHTTLSVEHDVFKLAEIPNNSALVCFSRKDVFMYKNKLEGLGRKVSVIYGNLSPKVRNEESRRFREGETDILVSTDAIAMGLNLPIKNIIFTTLEKFDGEEMNTLKPEEVRQIAGRAGRFGKFESGHVYGMQKGMSKTIESLYGRLTKANDKLYITPKYEHILEISEFVETSSIVDVLNIFNLMVDKSGYERQDMTDMMTLAEIVDEFDLSIKDKFTLVCSPVSTRIDEETSAFRRWVMCFANKKEVRVNEKNLDFNPRFYDSYNVHFAETESKIMTVYSWLSEKFESVFCDGEKSREYRDYVSDQIIRYLRHKAEMQAMVAA